MDISKSRPNGVISSNKQTRSSRSKFSTSQASTEGRKRPGLATGPASDALSSYVAPWWGGPHYIIHARVGPAWTPLIKANAASPITRPRNIGGGRRRGSVDGSSRRCRSSSSSRSRGGAAELWSVRLGLEAMEREETMGEEEEVEVACACCGFTEECTAPYIAGVRARYDGRWICGLCGDAVGEELGRASPSISPAEALDRHACVCRRGGSTAPPSPAGSADELIAALRLLLRRRLGSPPLQTPRKARKTPSSPRRAAAAVAVVSAGGAAAGGSLGRTESCFAALVE